MQDKIKIVFVLPSLVPGGAERVMSFISQNIDKKRFSPTLLVVGFKKDSSYDVSNVDTVFLNKGRVLTAIPQIMLHIFRHKPNIVVSAISHTNAAMSIIAPYFKNTKFIGREATVLGQRKNEKKSRKWSPMWLISNRFKNLDQLICQSIDMSKDMIKNYQIPKKKIVVINNPISNLPKIKKQTEISTHKRFITVGRLTEVKGHLRILDILSKLNTPFTYTIIGNGGLKEEIFSKADKLGLLKNIKHIPFTNKVNDYIAENDMFLQGSYVEGFPNALLESCVVGVPVIAFNAPGGTKEIVENGINGFLVNNESEFLEKLKDIRTWNPNKVRESVYKKFNKETILNQYEDLFINALK